LDLFQQVCPGISFQEIMDALQEAVDVFGRTRVFSNIILGLGESDKVLRHGIDELAEMGVMPILRAVYPHPLRAGDLEMTRPSPQRPAGTGLPSEEGSGEERPQGRSGRDGLLSLHGVRSCASS